MSDFAAALADAQEAVSRVLASILDTPRAADGSPPRSRLLEAMRYATLSGGKRLRPFVVIETARLFGKTGDGVVRVAAALECIHCYSLIHDDLPAMDDDDLRRGRPTVHRAFDEATAILAGDALLTLAFAILADPATDADPEIRTALTAALANAAGHAGMAGGQMLDLDPARLRSDAAGAAAIPPVPFAAVMRIMALKTGALFQFAAVAGAILGRAKPAERVALARYGSSLGIAYQVADDLLDLTATTAAAGKATGKDSERGKATLVGLEGIDAGRRHLAAFAAAANAALAGFTNAAMLSALVTYVTAPPA